MLYAVLFEDNEDQGAMRTKHMADHLAFLDRHAAQITAAGPLKDAENEAPAGGLWLVEAEDANAVRALIEADPFWPTGLRKSHRLLAWTQVFAAGKQMI
jgi:hypothetical protein